MCAESIKVLRFESCFVFYECGLVAALCPTLVVALHYRPRRRASLPPSQYSLVEPIRSILTLKNRYSFTSYAN
jgi:hypothetical protein